MSREQFEAWAKTQNSDLSVWSRGEKSGAYKNPVVAKMWESWQAASKASEQQLAALAANNALLKDALLEEGYRYFNAETEVTDAYLAEVRAQGVDAAIEKLIQKFEGTGHIGVPVMVLEHFAAQLRQGDEQ